MKPIHILLIEDNEGDILLTREALNEGKIANSVSVVKDGAAAMDFLLKKNNYYNATRPDLILLDLNLPKIEGKEVLAKIKTTDQLKTIPVVVLTTSSAERDIVESYNNYANCFITKPVDLSQFMDAIKALEDFWITIVKLPGRK